MKKRDNVDGQDLLSVLRLFAEIASSADNEKGTRAPNRHDLDQGGEDLAGVRSSPARQLKKPHREGMDNKSELNP